MTVRKIHLLELVLQILVSARVHPENLFPEDLFYDITSEGSTSDGPWDAFKYWFYYLLCREYLWEAQRILQSLMHELPRREYRILVQHFITQAMITSTSQESIKIAVSSLVQHFIYFSRSPHSNPLAAVPWNDDVTSALFGLRLTESDDMATSKFSRSYLRLSIEEELDLNKQLPLEGVNDDDTMDDLLHEAALDEDAAIKLAVNAGPSLYTLDELNGGRNSSAALIRLRDMLPGLPYLDTNIVDTRDCYQRTLLHWASLKGRGDAVKALLNTPHTDVGSLDWFECTSLHYAVKSCVPESTTDHVRIVESLLNYDSASVNTRDPNGQSPLHVAILNRSLDVAKLLLLHNASVEISHYGALLLLPDLDDIVTWKLLLSEFDDGPPPSAEQFEEGSYQGAPLSYPGAIEFDTAAALILRELPPQTTAADLRPLLAFLEHDYSDSAFPAFQRGHRCLAGTAPVDHLDDTAQFRNFDFIVESGLFERRVWKMGEGREDVILASRSGMEVCK